MKAFKAKQNLDWEQKLPSSLRGNMLETGRKPHHGGRRLWLVVAFLAAVLPASAQYSSGVQATIVDQNGAVIPSAQVI
jgi:hypothetical protein